jgi:hypothetical protein
LGPVSFQAKRRIGYKGTLAFGLLAGLKTATTTLKRDSSPLEVPGKAFFRG